MRNKVIGTREYVSILKELVNEGKEVSMVIVGSSMSPFLIHQRDTIFFKKPDRDLKRGDIVFYQRDNGQYVCHRICKITKDGYYLVGDAQTEVEGPLREEQIFARIYKVKRKGKELVSGNFIWNFFERIWIRVIPLRPIAIWILAKIRA
ncbi:hypothetical protein P261_00903 [Lachnospiraceae bacterium TWA4]|nr:hypothetical protein P261_00903 [Lachnospiraceae bacterium TWA4]